MPNVTVRDGYLERSLLYGALSLEYTYDRMQRGEDYGAKVSRFQRIRDGLIVQQAAADWLREQGLEVDTRTVETDWRSADRGDVLVGDNVLDTKGLRAYGMDSQEAVDDRGWALVPVNQLNRHKDAYVFAFYDWENTRYPFLFTTRVGRGQSQPQLSLDGERVTVGIFSLRDNRGVVQEAVVENGIVSGLWDPDDTVALDAVMAFSDQFAQSPLNLVTERGRSFSTSATWYQGDFGIRPINMGVYLVGWAEGNEVRQMWEHIPRGDTRTHLRVTRVENRGTPVANLRNLDTLPNWLFPG